MKNKNMAIAGISLIAICLTIVVIAGCSRPAAINSYETCAAAGYPVTKGVPPQCIANGVTYTADIGPQMGESKAIETIKNQFPEFRNYPSDNLPPKTIKTEKAADGWHVAFVQEGSGRPIISATCFFVDNNKGIMGMKTYAPAVGEDSAAEFSPKTCSPGACSLENCHGLDIRCGSNPPDVCTEIYMVGDKCLQYAKCGVQNGKCQQIENAQFTQCKACVEKCVNDNKNDNMKLFECESNCK